MPLKVFDSHFHLLNHDINTSQINQYYLNDFINDYNYLDSNISLEGGICVEALSASYPKIINKEYNDYCDKEISWFTKQLENKKNYYFISPIALESNYLENNINKLENIYNCVGVRQILNYNPSWPRNKYLGDLVVNKKWVNGLNVLSESNLHFDLQINPHQFENTYKLIKNIKNINFTIDHMGLPLYKDFNNTEYWDGLKLFSNLDNVFVKLSRLSYFHNDWDKYEPIKSHILKVKNIFGFEKILYGSNLPIENNFDFDIKRIVDAFIKLFEKKSHLIDLENFFYNNSLHAYRVI